MKTLVLLSALAALAAAAPATENQSYNKLSSFPQQIKRNKKSAFPEEFSEVDDETLPINDDNIPEARTLGLLKKKATVKNTHGSSYHHSFRDSSEEKAIADPKEKCTKEVKVKFCEEEHAARSAEMKSTSVENVAEPLSDIQVKESLQKAREMVENIQKMTQKNAKSASNTEMHEDIEIARKALNHIQQNFEKLESLNLRFATLSNPELQNTHLETSKSDKRNAQWKGELKNTQKNADLPENNQEILKSVDHSIVDIDTSMKLPKSANLVMAIKSDKPIIAKSSEHVMDLTVKNNVPEDDLAIAASEPKESIVELKEKSSVNFEPSKLVGAQKVKEELPKQPKNPEFSASDDSLKSTFELKSSMKAAALNPETKQVTVPEIKVDLAAPLSPALSMKSVTDEKTVPELKATPDFTKSLEMKSVSEHDEQHTVAETKTGPSILAHEKSAAVENFNKNLNTKEINTDAQLKLQEQPHTKSVEEIMPIMKSSVDKEDTFKDAKIFKNTEKDIKMKAVNDDINVNKDQVMIKSAHLDQQINMPSSVPQMKSAESVIVQHFEPSDIQTQEKSVAMKAADPEPHFHHIGIGGHESVHSTHHHSISNTHHIGHQHHHLQHLHGGHPIFKSPDMDAASSTVQLDMQEAGETEQNMMQWNPTQKAALEQKMMQWSQKHNARGAYGAYGAGGSAYGAGLGGGAYGAGASGLGGHGAVGAVFPRAKNSNCAIPLLLSCSPSVTSGSLKSHSYGVGSAYRSDDFNMHSKRDTKKTSKIPNIKAKRTFEKNTLKTAGNKIQL